MTEAQSMAASAPGSGAGTAGEVTPETPGVDVISYLGFDPETVQAVVVTGDSIVGVSASMPGGPPPPDPQPEPDPEPEPT